MIVCVCHAISDQDIQRAATEGASSLEHLSDRFNLGLCCGTCRDCAADCLNNALRETKLNTIPVIAG